MNPGFALANAILSVALVILSVIKWLVIIAAVISWVNPDPRNAIVQFLYKTTNPILRPFRKILPPSRTGGIDLSPILVILVILFLEVFLKSLFTRSALAF